jgi:subtilisin family serine protease
MRTGALLASLAATALLTAVAAPPAAAATDGTTHTYLVLYHAGASTSGAATLVRSAGGALVANYPAIGVVIARSDSASFAAEVGGKASIDGVASTDSFGVRLNDEQVSGTDAVPTDAPAPGSDAEPLSGLQWDMSQIKAFAAHEITGGSPDIVVGDLDTGLDFTHPDLAPNYRADKSADCSSGAPAPLQVGNDQFGHGTHTAGTIAAAVNGIGITGVAPNVGIAGVKSSNDDGYFFPEMVVCAYYWVATHGINVTNNSYFADPWLFNCKNDPTQRVIWNAERRAMGFAQSRGTVVVASEGNDATDLSHPTVDVISPDFPPNSAVERSITNACAVFPVEAPGVIGVTATSNRSVKSFYSSYGISTADVAAPGGDSLFFDRSASVPNGRVLSTYPPYLPCGRKVVDPSGATYCYLQGTSMAGPHAAGLAALLLSRGVPPHSVQAAMQSSAHELPCPDSSYGETMAAAGFPQNNGELQECTGGLDHNSFYGAGEIDALAAVS